MEIIKRFFKDVLLIKTHHYNDDRGSFFESYNYKELNDLIKKDISFVQDNCSISKKGVVRGMGYQIVKQQGKLIRVLNGKIFDVVVDLRKDSPTFSNWGSFELNAENNYSLWIPEGFAHGFLAMENNSIVLFKVTDYWQE